MNKLVFTVTNDLVTDQRMSRICGSLSEAGYPVLLVGREQRDSLPLSTKSYEQKRLFCIFRKGKLFYAEFNIRLFFFLLFCRARSICAIDLDTIVPCFLVSALRRIPRVYDAHELFCEMKEVVTRPFIHRIWKKIEKIFVPRFRNGYTVSPPIAEEFFKMYGVQYEVIRNLPVLTPAETKSRKEKFILYQGAVNEGRSFETLIPAMAMVEAPLVICGDGNFMKQAQELVEKNGLNNKVRFTGRIPPSELGEYTRSAWIGVTLFENTGLSNYFSLGNRFFDYIHAGLPQVCVDYPAYRELNNLYQVAVLTESLDAETLAGHLNHLLSDEEEYNRLQKNCLVAREELNWQKEEKKLLAFYQMILS